MLTYLRAVVATRIRNERGASAVEYGLLAAGVLAACVFGFETLSATVRAVFSKQNSDLSTP